MAGWRFDQRAREMRLDPGVGPQWGLALQGVIGGAAWMAMMGDFGCGCAGGRAGSRLSPG